MKKTANVTVCAFVLIFTLQGCFFNFSTLGVGSWHNKTIDGDVRDKIDALNKALFKNLTSANTVAVKKLMSDASLKTSGLSIDTLVKSFTGTKALTYKVLDEFYLKRANEVSNVVLTSNNEDSNDYRLNFVAINKETYVSVLVSTDLPLNFMILAIYGKYGDEWKLNILRAGNYSAIGQTAPDHYLLALKHYQESNYVDALDMIVIASELAYPGGDKFEYINNNDMKDLYMSIIKEAKTVYHFPIIVSDVKSKPQLFSISPQFVSDGEPNGIFPVVKYKTDIKLTDTNALKAENKELQKYIGVVFKGIDKNKPGIIYQMYNRFPVDSTKIDHYTIVQKIGYKITHSSFVK
jgi:hypothetical protein